MERDLLLDFARRLENLLIRYREVCEENRRLQEQVTQLSEERTLVKGRVDALLVKLGKAGFR